MRKMHITEPEGTIEKQTLTIEGTPYYGYRNKYNEPYQYMAYMTVHDKETHTDVPMFLGHIEVGVGKHCLEFKHLETNRVYKDKVEMFFDMSMIKFKEFIKQSNEEFEQRKNFAACMYDQITY